jgi:NADPH:quinone reductase-like Zn-dependent oxidoreductase
VRAYAIDHFGSLDDLELRQLERPVPDRGEVQVRVKGAALNPADWKILTGRDGGKFLHAAKFPLVLGYDFSGTVEEVGPDATGIAAGDDVYGHLPYSRKNRQGTMADYVAVPADTVAKKPSSVSHVEAACAATTASTALQALRDKAGLRSGQRALVNGASGGVGSYAVQIANILGAEVWGTCSAAKADFVESLGTHTVIDYREQAITDLDETFDVVLDAASTSSFGECNRILRKGGAYITLLPSLSFLTGWLRALFSSKKNRVIVVKSRRGDLAQLAEWMEREEWHHPVDSTYRLDELPDAMRRIKSGEVCGKIGISLDEHEPG